MTIIQQDDVIRSVADALQYISFYHPVDYIANLARAYEHEQSHAAKDAIAQILINSRMCAEGHRPICQDTGIVTAFVKVGMEVQWAPSATHGMMSMQQMIDQGTREAWLNPDNLLRPSILADPAFTRKNTGDNTPAMVVVELVEGSALDITVASKGGGSEAKAKFAMLNPTDSLADWVVRTVPTMGAGWCPPGMLGIGIGGTAEKSMVLAKESLMDPINMHELIQREKTGAALTNIEKLRIELYNRINQLGIGAQGLGGLTTVLDVKILDCPTHAANLPVAIIPNCAATRHLHIRLDGSGPVAVAPPSLDAWPKLTYAPQNARRVNLAAVNREDIQTWKPGEVILLTGSLLTGRDAAHKRLTDMLNRGETLPVDLRGRFLYYVGPVQAVGDEAVGPAGPTTATRMDKFTRQVLAQTGLLGMIGKAERGPEAIAAIREFHSVYLIAVGGAAYLISKAIHSARVLAFADLGMEAIYEFDVVDMPVTVAVDSLGSSVHTTGPAEWHSHIAHHLPNTAILQ
jgi:fumarate hydratase class I